MFTLAKTRQNLLRWSEDFSVSTAWATARINRTGSPAYLNQAIAPDGTLTADKMIEDTALGAHHTWQYVPTSDAVGDGETATVSVSVRAVERSRVQFGLILKDNVTFRLIGFDLSAGSIFATSSGYTGELTALGAGWWLAAVTGGVGSGASQPRLSLFLDNGTTTAYTGDGVSGIYIHGASFVVGGKAPYTRTDSATVTTPSDFVTIDPIKYDRKDELLQNIHRMKSGAGFRYIWGSQTKAKFSASVDSSTACRVNSWWGAGDAVVLQQTNDPSMVLSGYIVNKVSPFNRVEMALNTEHLGSIELESY